MELIDRDELLEQLATLLEEREKEAAYTGSREINVRWDDAIISIKGASAVDPVQHGYWIHGREISRDYTGNVCVAVHYENWRCSKCNYTDGSPLLNFCPNCGAKMDDRRIKYRKKPIVIEAYQTDVEMDIETLEGVMHANIGDYIITGVNGEQYPCKPDIFEQTYDEVRE